MPNRNWKERKEYWKKYFLGERSKSVNFRLGVAYCSLGLVHFLWTSRALWMISKNLDIALHYVYSTYFLSHIVFLFPVAFFGEKRRYKFLVLLWLYLCGLVYGQVGSPLSKSF